MLHKSCCTRPQARFLCRQGEVFSGILLSAPTFGYLFWGHFCESSPKRCRFRTKKSQASLSRYRSSSCLRNVLRERIGVLRENSAQH